MSGSKCARWRSWLLLIGLVVGPSLLAAESAGERFAAIWQAEWNWRLEQSPALATHVGEHRHDHRLGDASPEAHTRRAQHWRAVLAELDAIDPGELPAGERIDYAIFRAQVESFAEEIELGGHLIPFNSDSSFWSGLGMLPQMHPWRSRKDVENYLARLEAVPAWFDEHIALMRLGLERGMTLPKAVLDGRDVAVAQVAAISDPTQAAWYAPFAKLPADVSETEGGALRERARKAIAEGVIPAHGKLLAFLREEYFPNARDTLGASALPNGAAYYRRQIREYVTLDLSPEEIHQAGLKELERIGAAMEAIRSEVGFEGDLEAFFQFLRTDPQFYAQTPEELLMHAAWIAKRADAALPRFFGHLPRKPYGVAPVPEAIAPYYTAGRYVGPPENSPEPGWYWVNTHQLDSRPLHSLPALTLHEAVPGHHLQIALAAELGEQPPFRRHSYISAYGEGWALYAEELGHEMGIYRTPYERFGQLSYAAWRASRLVVDTGIHAMGWSREQSLDFMRAHTALSEHEIGTEVDRYISWPGQALSYMIGMIRIRELRGEAEQVLGPDFDVRAFHDAMLALGSVPLDVLERETRGWIAGQAARVP
jgi:uncharacterized protein (DUF885 family)